MVSLIFFDSYVKYDYDRFLASELNNIKPTPNQEAELKKILNLIKQQKKNWFIARFLHSGGHLQDSNWNIKRDGILKKLGCGEIKLIRTCAKLKAKFRKSNVKNGCFSVPC